jgi:hypothetical protein
MPSGGEDRFLGRLREGPPSQYAGGFRAEVLERTRSHPHRERNGKIGKSQCPREEAAVFLDESRIICPGMRRPKRRLTTMPPSLRRFGWQINMPVLKRTGGKFVVSRAGEAYDAMAIGLISKFGLRILGGDLWPFLTVELS